MAQVFFICLSTCAIIGVCHGVSTKMDFGDEEESTTITNSTKVGDEDVEVKHTIVVSTKLKNNNRRGLHSDDGTGVHVYSRAKESKDDSGEVPIVNGYKSVETTLIRTPDTRYKNRPSSQFVPSYAPNDRNAQDEFNLYPNYINVPNQWKPSTMYNNINWDNQELPIITYNVGLTNTANRRPAYQTPGKFHRRISNDGMKEFYCSKCRELQGVECGQPRSNPWTYVQTIHETTTQKIKLDGKLVKLN